MQKQMVLAFDYGLKHIGTAVGQSLIGSANPEIIIRARDGKPDWSQVEKLLREWQPDVIVVGLPLNMDGTDSPMSERARKFSRQLKERARKPVFLIDERLTSFAAKQARRDLDERLDFGRDTVDAEAACIILQDYFNQLNANTLPQPV